MGDLTYYVAFTSGLVSFFLPCILPLLPVYFGYLAGEAIQTVEGQKVHKKLLVNALAFVLGLTLLNLFLGFGARAASDLLIRYSEPLRITGGVLMILFGLYFIFGLRLGFIERERKLQYRSYSPGFFKSLVLGITFSFGWTPCSGPVLATILMMASFQKNYLSAGTLMIAYSMGFAVMFLLSAFLVGIFVDKVRGIYRHFGKVKIAAGLIMMAMGLLMLADKMYWLNIE